MLIFWRLFVVSASKVKAIIIEITWDVEAYEPLVETVAVSSMFFLLVFFFKC